METNSESSNNNMLEVEALIGFEGGIRSSLHVHHPSTSLVFSIGSTVFTRNLETQEQHQLKGHEAPISELAVSPFGTYIASAEAPNTGFPCLVLVWDWESKKILHKLNLHKDGVNAIAFSKDEKYMVTIGSLDDRSRVIVWSLETGKALFCLAMGNQEVRGVQFFNNDSSRLAVITEHTIQLLQINEQFKKIEAVKCGTSNLKRNFLSLAIEENDEFIYAGTRTGDVLEIQISTTLFRRVAPIKRLLGCGVRMIQPLPNGDLLLASGSGTVARVDIQKLSIRSSAELVGRITGLSLTKEKTSFFCGTNKGNIYYGNAFSLDMKLRASCHDSKINAIAFPKGYGKVFATCSKEEIRVWSTDERKELLRMNVPKVECYCVAFSADGKTILSGWSDGSVRGYFPQSGKLKFQINDAHPQGVTSLVGTSESQRLVTGGQDGTVRVWQLGRQKQTLLHSMKEHRSRVWSLKLSRSGTEALSCSADGSCIIWDLQSYSRVICIFDKIVFRSAVYHPDSAQILTTGSDRRVGYWEVFDGQLIRSIETADEERGEVNTLAMEASGKQFLTGSSDGMIKLWDYDLGTRIEQRLAHSGGVTALQISPEQDRVISVGTEGSIVIWKYRHDL